MSLADAEAQHRLAVETVPDEKLTEPEKPAGRGTFELYVGPSLLALCVIAFAVLAPWAAFITFICLALLTPCVVFHEFAHLIAARRAGMEVREFSIGFGQRMWSRQWRGIRWSLKLLPLGGSVEIAGMTVEEVERSGTDPKKAFIYKPPLVRLRVALAGVAANVLLAWATVTVAVLAIAGGNDASWRVYLTAPLRALYMIWVIAQAGAEALGRAFFLWGDGDVGSILSLPEGFAAGAHESSNVGIPLMVYIVLFFAALNLSLALFNSLPLYPLDGYHGTTAVIDGARRWAARLRHSPFAPLSTWRLRWFSRGSSAVLALFIGSVLARDLVQMM